MAEAAWNEDLSEMPEDGKFEVMRIVHVYRWKPGADMVVDPITGRMFTPIAWRPINSAEQS